MKKLLVIFCFTSIILSQEPEWYHYYSNIPIKQMAIEGDLIWGATENGLVKVNQVTRNVEILTISNSGLPGNDVRCIAIDSAGKKWIGTFGGGLAQFDGQNWRIFNPSNSGLVSNYVTSIDIDKKGTIWLGIQGGIASYNGNKWTYSYTDPASGLHPEMRPIIKTDPRGNKWVIVEDQYYGSQYGIAKYNDTTWTRYSAASFGLGSAEYFTSISVDASGNKWLAANTSDIIKFSDNSFKKINTSELSLSGFRVNQIAPDVSGNIWLISEKSIVKYDGSNSTQYNPDILVIPFNKINNFQLDKTGIMWFTTENGFIIKYDGNNPSFYYGSNSGLPGKFITTIAIEANNTKWIGTRTSGLVKFDGTNWRIFNPNNSGMPSFRVSVITIDSKGVKWIGTEDKGVVRFDDQNWSNYNTSNSGVSYNNIASIAIDSAGIKWVATFGGGLLKYDDKTWTKYRITNSGIGSDVVQALAIDGKNNKWLALGDGYYNPSGVMMFDGTNWTDYTNSINNIQIKPYSIFADKKGAIWFGNYNALIKYNDRNWTVYAENALGLQPGEINHLTGDDDGNIWSRFNSLDRIFKFDGVNCIAYKTNPPNSSFNIIDIAIDHQGNKWLSRYGGISVFKEGGVYLSAEKTNNLKTSGFYLNQNYPNPFNPATVISYSIPSASHVRLKVYNLLGNETAILVNEEKNAGKYSIQFNGEGLPSGVYFYTIQAGAHIESRKMTIIK